MLEKSKRFWVYEVNIMNKHLKSAILRGLIGACVGITLYYLIALIISGCIHDGTFYIVDPEVAEHWGSQLNGAVVSTCLTVLMGVCFGASSVIFDLDHWSILKQTAVHFLVIFLAYFGVAYALHWFDRNLGSFLVSLLIFLFTYAGIWLGQYWGYAKKVKAINQGLEDREA